MTIEKGLQPILTATDTDETVDFQVKGAGLIVVTQLRGSWQLVMVAPDGLEIPLISDITKPLQQAYANAPQGTKLRFTGDTGARANIWVGQAFNEAEGLLL